jgi:hypothetical protein
MDDPLSPEDVKQMLANPINFGLQVHPLFTERIEGKPPITEEVFIEAAIIMINDLGPKEYLHLLFENLRGNW